MEAIYKQSKKAYDEGWDWDKTIYEGELEIVEEFDTTEEAVEAFDNKYCGDCDTFFVGPM